MSFRIRYVVQAFTAVALIGAEGSFHENPVEANEPKVVSVTEKDDGGKIKLNVGDTLLVKLSEQAGTGFGWKIAKNDDKILKLQGKPEVEKPKDDAKPKVGGRVTRVWRFKVEGKGDNELEMHYQRPFEKNVPPAKTFKVTVKGE